MKERRPIPQAEADGLIEGRNAVTEALRAGTPIDKIFLARGETDATLGHIAAAARDKGIVVVECDRRKLDFMSQTHSHQGVIAQAAVREYASVDDILNAAREKGEPPLIVVCDELSDPHNLGAVIRTAECAGAHGVIIPKRRSAGLPAVVAKTSAAGPGMGRLGAETCDFKGRSPMKGKLNSLTASAAAAILLYEAVRQRMG